MATINDITLDALVSRGNNKNYEDNYDTIFPENFGKVVDNVTNIEYSKCSKRCWLEVSDNVKTCMKKGCTTLEV